MQLALDRRTRQPFAATLGVLCWLAAVRPAAAQAAAPAGLPESTHTWVHADTALRRVTLELETAAGPAGSPALINGYQHGEIQIVVPLGWTIEWRWQNQDSTRNHSLVVMVEREKLPLEGGRPSFTNAITRSPVVGLKPGQRDSSNFEAEAAGWYWLLCGVPSHALEGEWIGLKVDRSAGGVEVIRKK